MLLTNDALRHRMCDGLYNVEHIRYMVDSICFAVRCIPFTLLCSICCMLRATWHAAHHVYTAVYGVHHMLSDVCSGHCTPYCILHITWCRPLLCYSPHTESALYYMQSAARDLLYIIYALQVLLYGISRNLNAV